MGQNIEFISTTSLQNYFTICYHIDSWSHEQCVSYCLYFLSYMNYVIRYQLTIRVLICREQKLAQKMVCTSFEDTCLTEIRNTRAAKESTVTQRKKIDAELKCLNQEISKQVSRTLSGYYSCLSGLYFSLGLLFLFVGLLFLSVGLLFLSVWFK